MEPREHIIFEGVLLARNVRHLPLLLGMDAPALTPEVRVWLEKLQHVGDAPFTTTGEELLRHCLRVEAFLQAEKRPVKVLLSGALLEEDPQQVWDQWMHALHLILYLAEKRETCHWKLAESAEELEQAKQELIQYIKPFANQRELDNHNSTLLRRTIDELTTKPEDSPYLGAAEPLNLIVELFDFLLSGGKK